jgi:outer membrane protein TolC
MGLSLEEEETTRPEWSLIANFNLNLSLNAYMGFKVYQTVLDWKQGKINLDIAKEQVKRDVKKNMNILVINKKEIEILEEELENARKRYNRAVINYKNGLISEYDMLSTEVSYERRKPEILNAKNQYFKQLLYFKQMLGLKKEVEIIFNNDVISNKIVLNKDEILEKFLSNNLDLKAQLNTIESFKNARNIAISFLTPTFSIGYSMDPAFQDDPIEEDWFGDKEYMDDNWKQNNGSFSLSLSIPLSSLIPFSKEHVDIIKSQYNIEVAKLLMENLKNGIEINIEMIFAELAKSVESIDILKLNVKKAERAFQKAEEGFYAGIKDRLEVDESESALKKAKVNLLQEELNYTNNLFELEYIINSKI